MRRIHALIALGLALVCAHVVVGQNQAITQVDIVDSAYLPNAGVSSVGSTVTWINKGNLSHTVTFDSGQGSSGILAPDETFRFTFFSTGRYSYHCAIHPDMKGYVDALPNRIMFSKTWLPLAIN